MNRHPTMTAAQSRGGRHFAPRAGLAPLELVLALPLLLCVMALIVNFAHAATWKIRTATSARLAMWRHRPMWNADMDPKPVNFWPSSASLGVSGDSRITQVDPIWNQPAIAQGWIKGPAFAGGGGYLAVRDNRVNEMSEGVSKGSAQVSLRYPFLPSMGIMTMPAEHSLMDSVWQYHTMGYPWNDWRRAKGWWHLESGPEWETQRQRFLSADRQMTSNPQRELMRPLDRDLDLISFFGHTSRNSDFYTAHPGRREFFCDNDPQRVHDMLSIPGGYLDEINGSKLPRTPGVCERMAGSYLQMYQAELNDLQSLDNPPAARIAQLQQWIQELSDFIAKLQ